MQNDLNTVNCENFGRIVFGDNIKHVTKISEKEVKHYYLKTAYDKLKESDFKAQVKYNHQFNVPPESWSTIYNIPFNTVYDHKIIDLQYRIVHRYIGTRSLFDSLIPKT